MQAGAVNIKLIADIMDLQAKMAKVPAMVSGAMNGIKSAVNSATAALAGLAAGFTVAAMAGWIKGAIDAADAASKLSAKTGVNVKDLAGLELAYKLAGVGQDGMATSLSKLAKNISDNNIGLRALGISTRESSGELRSTSSVLRDVADKFVGLEDGTSKTALAMEIFGKTGADLIPLLNGGSAAMDEMDAMAKKLGLSISEDAAANSEKFNDTMDLLQLGGQGVARTIAADLLPTLTNLAGSFLESMTEGDRLKNVAAFLSSGLKILYSVGVGIVEVFSTVGKTIGAVAAMVTAALRGDFAGAMSIGREAASDIGAGWSATARQVSAAWDVQSNSAVTSAVTIMKSNKDLLGAEKAREEAAKASAAASQKAAAEAAKMAEEGAKLAASLLAVESGLSGDFAKKWAELNAAYKTGAINLDVLVKAQAALLTQQPMMKAAYETAVKASNEAAAARKKESDGIAEWMRAQAQAAAQSLASVRDRITGLRQEEQALATSRKLNISVAEAVEKLTIARMEEAQAAKFWEGSEGWLALQKEIDARKELLGVMSSQAVRQKEESGWLEIWNSVDRTAHDTFVNIFEGGQDAFTKLRNVLKSTLLDLLYQMTVKKWIFNISASVTGTASGIASAAGMDGGGGGAGGMMNIASGLSSASGLYAAGSYFASGFTGTMLGSAAGMGATLPGSAVGIGAMASGTGATGLMGSAGSALGAMGPYGWVALAALAAFAIFSGDKDPASVSTGDTRANYDKDGKRTGGSNQFGFESAQTIAATDALQKTYADMARNLGVGVVETAFELGGNSDGKTTHFGIGSQAGKSSYGSADGLEYSEAAYQLEASRAVMSALKGSELPRYLTGVFDNISASSATQEQINNVLAYAGALKAFDATLQLMPFENLRDQSYAAMQGLIGASGGLEALQANLGYYFENFYGEGERAAVATASLTAQFAALGITVPDNAAQLRDLIAAQDISTAAGQNMAASLLGLAPAFQSVAAAARASAQQMMNVMSSYASAGEQRQYQLEQIQKGLADGGVNVSTGQLGSTSRDQAWQFYKDAVAANDTRTADAIFSQLDAFAKVTDAAQSVVFGSGVGSSSGGGSSGSSAAASIANAWQAITDSIWGEVKRIRGLLEGSGQDAFAAAQMRFTLATAQARAGDQDAAKALPQLSQAMLMLAEDNAGTLIELQRIRAQAAASLMNTNAGISSNYGTTIPSFDVGTNYVPRDMLAMIHKGEEITPAAYNPAAGGRRPGGGDDGAVVAELRAQNALLMQLLAVGKETKDNTGKTKDVLVRVTHDGQAMQSEPA